MAARAVGGGLPEPAHPFARWFGTAVIGLWALGVQSFPEPWSKLGAILSPGFGYLAGQGLEAFLSWLTLKNTVARRADDLRTTEHSIKLVEHELATVRQSGGNDQVVAFLETALTTLRVRRAEMLTQTKFPG